MELIMTKDAAKLLGVNPATLWRWAKEGKIKYYKTLGGRHRYDLKDIQRILKEGVCNDESFNGN